MIIKLQTDVVSYQKIKGKHSLGVKSAQLVLFGVCIKSRHLNILVIILKLANSRGSLRLI